MTETSTDTAAYFQQAGSWADDRTAAMARSRRTAWIVAGLAMLLAVLLAITLLLLLPLKSVVPYTLLVDRQTGFVQTLDPIAAQRIGPDTALTQSFLVQYVLAREGFDIATVQQDFRKVSLWSDNTAKSDYSAMMQVANPASPLARLPRTTVIDARIRSVSSIGKDTALVRFETQRRDRGGQAQPPEGWIALITYRYVNAPMAVEDRFLNPLGFQVVRYRRSAETPPAPVVPGPGVTTPVNTNVTAPSSNTTQARR
jgi:type IV secretion system protein VirB8